MGNDHSEGPAGEQETANQVPQLQPIRHPLGVSAVALTALVALALFYTLYFGRDFFLPIAIASTLALLFSPAIAGLSKAHIPQPVGAAIILILLLGAVVTTVVLLSAPANHWLKSAPENLQRVEEKLRALAAPAESLSRAAARVEHLTDNESSSIPKVELQKPGLLDSVWLQTKDIAYITVEVFILLYFLLAFGDTFLLKAIQILPRLRDKKKAVEIAHGTQKGVSQYLLVMTLINLYEGTVIGLGLWLLGLPTPLLWGVLAFFANFIPYLGALLAGSTVTVVALVTFDSVGKALLAPAIYFGTNFLDNFMAPYLFGRRLVLNPVVVFIAVMFWGWIWGIAGVLLAVPITVTIRIFCQHVPWLAPFAEFLSSRRTESAENHEAGKPALVQGNA